jgi:Tfp pilus assembly protein PilZ
MVGPAMAPADESNGAERRQKSRRSLPFGRGAVLQISDRSHVVGLADLSEGGALVLTRASASVGDTGLLRLSMVSRRVELALPCAVVRVVNGPSGTPQKGLALRFVDPDPEALAAIASFVARVPRDRQP